MRCTQHKPKHQVLANGNFLKYLMWRASTIKTFILQSFRITSTNSVQKKAAHETDNWKATFKMFEFNWKSKQPVCVCVKVWLKRYRPIDDQNHPLPYESNECTCNNKNNFALTLSLLVPNYFNIELFTFFL